MSKEKEFIKTIKTILNSEYIGDDCAYLKDLGITVSQDSLVEDVHFSLKYSSPYQIGWKSVMVNISDICASGAEPEYLTIALSLPNSIDKNFVEEFYKGAKDASQDVKIVGGDITGSDKIYISVCAIGNAKNRKISSRSKAKNGYKIIISGESGNSAEGLEILKNSLKTENPDFFVKSHLMPEAQREFSKQIALNCHDDYAMMDTSDGLSDALLQIALASNVIMSVNSEKIPHNKLVEFEKVLYGGEDYQLLAAVPEYILNYLPKYYVIGEVKQGTPGVEIDGKILTDIDNKLYNHFGENNG